MLFLLTKFLSFYLRSGIRGRYLLIKFLSTRLKSLQCVPFKTPNGTIFLDLRISSSLFILAQPQSQTGEDRAMHAAVKAGDVVYDIGAHLGLYTIVLSQLVGVNGKVFAFEPNPELLPSLRKTLSPLTNVTLFEVALSDSPGDARLFIPNDASMGSLRDWTDGIVGPVHKVSCQTQSIDVLIEDGMLEVPQFIKCDVEGAELSVFRGGAKMLSRADGPIILFEANRKAAGAFGLSTAEYFRFLESIGDPDYSFFEISPSGIKPVLDTTVEYANIIAVPKSRLNLLSTIDELSWRQAC